MAKIWEAKPIEVYKDWVTAIIDEASDELSDWETKFIDSIWTRLMIAGTNLTEGQAERLESIYAEKTS